MSRVQLKEPGGERERRKVGRKERRMRVAPWAETAEERHCAFKQAREWFSGAESDWATS